MNQALKNQRVQELISLYNNGDIKECLLKANKVAKIYPEEPFVFNLIGVVSASIGSYEEAIESYKRALKINPNYFEVYNNLGVALNDSKKPKDAISYLMKALEINPHYPEAYNNLGNALKELEKLDQAIESYENAIKLNPKFIDPYTNLAIVFASKKNENEKAEYYFKKALEISPERTKELENIFDSQESEEASNNFTEARVVQQWTDENGHTWRVMDDGTHRWWNGSDWQKV